MSKICDLTYEEVLKRHPEIVKKAIDALRSSKSKSRDADLKTIKWSYQFATSCEALSFEQVMERSINPAAHPQPKEPETPEEYARDTERRSHSWLQAQVGRWYFQEGIPNPPELFETQLKYEIEADARHAAWNKKNAESGGKELEKLIEDFKKGGGVVLGLSRKPPL